MDGITIAGKSVTEHLEAINHLEAIALLEDLVAGKTAFTERVLFADSRPDPQGIDRSNAGVYRGWRCALRVLLMYLRSPTS